MATQALDGLGLREAELAALGRAAQSRLAGRAIPTSGKLSSKALASAGVHFRGFREYAAGDSLRSVNWRASVRCDRIQTQIYESELASKWHICLDGSASMSVGAGRAKWLLARQIAAAFAYVLLYCGNQAGLIVFSGRVDAFCPLGRGHGQYPRVLGLLADCRPHPPGSESRLAVCAERFAAGSSLLVISDFLAEDALQDTLGRWSRTGFQVHALQVLADDECHLPDHGRLSVRDIETGEQRLIADVPQASCLAAKSLGDLTAGLSVYCAKQGIPFTAVDPKGGWKSAVVEHLKGMRVAR